MSETTKILLSIAGVSVTGLLGVLFWVIKKYISSRDEDRRDIKQLCSEVSAISARQEGQQSFANALIKNNTDIALLKKDVGAIHKRFDDLTDILRDVLKIGGKT